MSESNELIAVLSRIADALEGLRPLAEKAVNTPHLWAAPGGVLTDRADKEAQAIVLLSQMDRPTVAAIARRVGVKRETLRRWPNFAKAWRRVHGDVRDVRRGHVDANGDIDAAVMTDRLS
jgi:hypothetical protein